MSDHVEVLKIIRKSVASTAAADGCEEAVKIRSALYCKAFDAAIEALTAANVRGLREVNYQLSDGQGRVVGWRIEADDVERMGASAFCLPNQVASALACLLAGSGATWARRSEHVRIIQEGHALWFVDGGPFTPPGPRPMFSCLAEASLFCALHYYTFDTVHLPVSDT